MSVSSGKDPFVYGESGEGDFLLLWLPGQRRCGAIFNLVRKYHVSRSRAHAGGSLWDSHSRGTRFQAGFRTPTALSSAPGGGGVFCATLSPRSRCPSGARVLPDASALARGGGAFCSGVCPPHMGDARARDAASRVQPGRFGSQRAGGDARSSPWGLRPVPASPDVSHLRSPGASNRVWRTFVGGGKRFPSGPEISQLAGNAHFSEKPDALWISLGQASGAPARPDDYCRGLHRCDRLSPARRDTRGGHAGHGVDRDPRQHAQRAHQGCGVGV